MKIIKRILAFLLVLIVAIAVGLCAYLHYLKPTYKGTISQLGLKEKADVYYDEYGIPHIYAQSQEDAWKVLGYVHAQDRLFQMELLRRVGGGNLSEIFGKDLVPIDKLFRTLGINEIAKRSAAKYFSSADSSYQKLALAYLDGINQYIEKGKTPIEFTMLGIKKQKFTTQDFYLIIGYMGFSFTEALRNDPVMSYVKNRWGNNYYNDLWHEYKSESGLRIPVYDKRDEKAYEIITSQLKELNEKLPVKIWTGSNSWVVAPAKSASGKVLFENDTHIGYSAPCVWYEAHLECPGYSLYGNFLAGFPFPLVGHTRDHAWGMTMFENDDFNFYREKQNPANENQYWYMNQWNNYSQRRELIRVKGANDELFTVKSTVHGPLVYGTAATKNVIKQFDSTDTAPVSAWWIYNMEETRTMQAGYGLCHAQSLEQMEQTASMIDAPGINLMYGDAKGNIAWWAVGKLYKLQPGVDCKIILDGTNGVDDKIEYLPFSENPKSINPPQGFVYSSNNQPDSVKGFLVPGYYAPQDRAVRINQLLNEKSKVDVDYLRTMSTDDTSPEKEKLAQVFCNVIPETILKDDFSKKVFVELKNWKGSHGVDEAAPVIFYNLMSLVMRNCMADELGETYFNEFVNSHAMKNTYLSLCMNDSSAWWDNAKTAGAKETRAEIIQASFIQCVIFLKEKYGTDISKYKWGSIHTIEHQHAIGRQKPFDKVFNVGPLSIPGGNETVNNEGFSLDTTGAFPVKYGPAMRIFIDFNDIENAVSVLPTGQSGYFFANHYKDQAELFTKNKFRKMMMNKDEIMRTARHHLMIEN